MIKQNSRGSVPGSARSVRSRQYPHFVLVIGLTNGWSGKQSSLFSQANSGQKCSLWSIGFPPPPPPHVPKDAMVKATHNAHPGTWYMTDLSTKIWGSEMSRDLMAEVMKRTACTNIGKNLETFMPKTEFNPRSESLEPNKQKIWTSRIQ